MAGTSSTSIAKGRSLLSWLAADGGVPADVRREFTAWMRGHAGASVGISIGTMIMAAAIAWHIPTMPFLSWAALTVLLGMARIVLLLEGRRKTGLPDGAIVRRVLLMPLGWAAVGGYGAAISLLSGDLIVTVLACLSAPITAAAACFRFCVLPRLATAMVALGMGPLALAALLSGEPAMMLAGLLIPLYGVTLILSVRQLNRMLVRGLMSEREMERRARIDSLTGLLNRTGLAQEIAQRIAQGQRFALIQLDLDGLRNADGSLRQRIDDAVLIAFADRLRALCTTRDVAARIGSDEFVVLSAVGDRIVAQATGDELIAALGRGSAPEAADVFAGISIGISIGPDHGQDLGNLLGEADAALHQAKYDGGARCVVARSRPPIVASSRLWTLPRPFPLRHLHRTAA